MKAPNKHWLRIAVTLIPLIFALTHATGVLRLGVLTRLDKIIYDTRLRATMPGTLDKRIVIVDIDEKSLAEIGHWPWGRNRLAQLVDTLFEQQQVALVGFDFVFAEADESSGWQHLHDLAQSRQLGSDPAFVAGVQRLKPALDYDALFAKALEHRPVVMGYYFSSDRDGRTTGVLPAPVMHKDALQGHPVAFTSWDGYASNIPAIASAAPHAGFFNAISDIDGVVRSLPLIAQYKGQYYESLALAMFRTLLAFPQVWPGFPHNPVLARQNYPGLDSIALRQGYRQFDIPVDDRVSILVPYRGPGGPKGGSFRYISAADLLQGKVAAQSLKNAIVLVGSSATGLQDQRATPVSAIYSGVEAHANVISALLDGRFYVTPDYAPGYEVLTLLLAGLALTFLLPRLTAARAVVLSAVTIAVLTGLNFWLFLRDGLVLPLASSLVMAVAAFALNMSFGYFVESRKGRGLARLFGTYVPPELVHEMVEDPDNYNMSAVNKELTVMFCDMRGFTKLSESMEPTEVQALLNRVFSRLTTLIHARRGTIDKYMGDCVMAFWGAPVDIPDHALLAVDTALAMSAAIGELNQENKGKGLPAIGVGIGLNTGIMCVGDMGSSIRQSYTVVGDAVNLGSRLEGLSKVYGVNIVVSEFTRAQAPDVVWQELDRVRVKGREQPVSIYWPMALAPALLSSAQKQELELWNVALKNYRLQLWELCDAQLNALKALNAQKYLYQLYSERVASMRTKPHDPLWDGAMNFETK